MKKRIGILIASIGAIALTLAVAVSTTETRQNLVKTNATDTFTITTSSIEDFVKDDSFYLKTGGGYRVKFETKGVSFSADKLVFAAGGYILNPYLTEGYHNEISGLTGIQITHSGTQGDIAVDYTWGNSLKAQAPYYQRRGFVFPVDTKYSFLSEKPNYVCVRAVNAITVESISFEYECASGTEKGDNLQITSASLLERFKTTVNWGNTYEGQTVELANDIDASSLKEDMDPIGNSTKPFKGTFEGNDHKISYLTIKSGAGYRGLFGNAIDATFQNLVLDHITVTSTSQYNGALVGHGGGCNIENVTVESGTINTKQGTGGIIGQISNDGTRQTYISNCVNKADIIKNASSTYALMGGIFGEIVQSITKKVIVTGCKNYGRVEGNQATSANNGMVGGIGGLIRTTGTGGSVEISHCANFGNVTSNKGSVGGVIGRARAGLLIDNYCSVSATIDNDGASTSTMIGGTGSSPAYVGRIVGITENTPNISIYDDCDEDGVSVNATAISTASELKAARDAINSAASAGSFYKLTNDIDVSGSAFGTGIGTGTGLFFAGVFDGCGHTISGLTNSVNTQAGLFYSAEGAIIKNLNMANVDLTATKNRAGGIIGRAKGTYLYNCHVLSGTVTTGTGEVGGIAGICLDATYIRGCSNAAEVTSAEYLVGGIVGYAYSNVVQIEHCYNSGDISSSKAYDVNGARVGGILGGTYINASTIEVTINASVNDGSITSNNRATGGIAGSLASNSSAKTHRVTNCINNGTVESTESGKNAMGTGGIVGVLGKLDSGANAPSNGYIFNCVNNGAITSGGGSVGGITGQAFAYSSTSTATIDSCYNFGSVTNTYSADDTTGIGTGGIVGTTNDNNASYTILDINNCVNVGTITGARYTGGIVGLLRHSVSGSKLRNSVNYGNVVSIGLSVGGVTGSARVNVQNCGCYQDALLTNKSQSEVLASTLDDVSANGSVLGYVASEVQNDPEITDSYLVNYHLGYRSMANPQVVEPTISNETIGGFTSFAANNVSAAYSWPSIEKLHNGKYLLASTSGYGISDTLSTNAFNTWKTRDNSYGKDYVKDPSTHEDTEVLSNSANFQPLVLPNGRVIIFYRTNATNNGDYRYSSIRAIVSDDNCATWTKYVLFENYGSSLYGGGAYEPFGVIKGDKIYVYFACDMEDSYYNGYGNDYSEFVCTTDSAGMLYQNILYFTIDIANNAFSVNNDVNYAIKATSSYRRPGMPSITRLIDGTYAMVYEHCGSIASMSNYWMQIAISYSRDLINWTTPINFITPNHTGIKPGTVDQYYLAGAPTVKLLPSGRIAVSYTTNEYYTGLEQKDFTGGEANYGQWFRTVELATSSNVIRYGSTPSMTRLNNVRTYGENVGANYGRCAVIDNKLILMSNNYTIDATKKGSTCARTKNSGIYFSVANLTISY